MCLNIQVPLFSSMFPKLDICSGDGTNTGLMRVNKLTVDKEVPKGVQGDVLMDNDAYWGNKRP